MKLLQLVAAAAVLSLTQGCATILTEKTSTVNLSSSTGKPVIVAIDGKEYQGPGIIKLQKDGKEKVVKSVTENCAPETALKREIEPTFFVNILAGGAFGSTTDMASKKMWKYQDNLVIACQ